MQRVSLGGSLDYFCLTYLFPIYTDWLIITHYVQYHSLHLFPIINYYPRTSDTGLKNSGQVEILDFGNSRFRTGLTQIGSEVEKEFSTLSREVSDTVVSNCIRIIIQSYPIYTTSQQDRSPGPINCHHKLTCYNMGLVGVCPKMMVPVSRRWYYKFSGQPH